QAELAAVGGCEIDPLRLTPPGLGGACDMGDGLKRHAHRASPAIVRKFDRPSRGADLADDLAAQAGPPIDPKFARLAARGLNAEHVERAALALPCTQVNAAQIKAAGIEVAVCAEEGVGT